MQNEKIEHFFVFRIVLNKADMVDHQQLMRVSFSYLQIWASLSFSQSLIQRASDVTFNSFTINDAIIHHCFFLSLFSSFPKCYAPVDSLSLFFFKKLNTTLLLSLFIILA